MKGEAANSPRTGAGISKSLLTPCRRLGLVRRRTTASPLTQGVSPTPADTPSATVKRTSSQITQVSSTSKQDSHASTPIRTLGQPRRQKSKKLITALTEDSSSPNKSVTEDTDCIDDTSVKAPPENEDTENENSSIVTEKQDVNKSKQPIIQDTKDTLNKTEEKGDEIVPPTRKKSKEKTPKRLSKRKSGDLNLTRKCMIVIDNHILKPANETSPTNIDTKENDVESVKQVISYDKFETNNENGSDVDDIPLSEICKNDKNVKKDSSMTKKRPRTLTLDEDDSDFCEKSLKRPERVNSNPKVAKLEKTKTTESSSSNEPSDKLKADTPKNPQLSNKPTQSESEDDDFDCRKTVVIRKPNTKKLHKAKSTGSITQKDIDDLKVRIKMKKNALLAKSGGHDVEELTELIKKWRRGCQEALMELLEIMKRRVPEKRNMKTVELLKMLNIPIELVHYNVEDEYFVSPN